MFKRLLSLLVLQLCTLGFAYGQSADNSADTATAHYMANEGLMVVQGETRILFDPLFGETYGYYQQLPKALEEELYAGVERFDDVDAVFISHYHGDHYSPEDILRLLKAQPGIRLYAPTQAVKALYEVADSGDGAVFDRVTAVSLAYKDPPVTLEMDGLVIEAVRIPHSGWPTGRTMVENISWRITLNETTTVVHMGDADPNDVHFARDAEYWGKGHTHMAFPPYWFYSSKGGNGILKQRIKPDHSVGVHVPVSVPDGLLGYDLFTHPGETRDIPVAPPQNRQD